MLSTVLLWLMLAALLVLPVLLRWAGDEPRSSEPDEAEPERLPDLEVRDDDPDPVLRAA